MSGKVYFFLIFVTGICLPALAQPKKIKKNRIYADLTEIYQLSTLDPLLKDGFYRAYYRRRHLIADGQFRNNKKSGLWHFYNRSGGLLESYQFDYDSLEFEAKEHINPTFYYLIDGQLTDSDSATKPIKPGGRFFGYLPFLKVFKPPLDVYGNAAFFIAQIQLLISPLGNLADYKVRLVAPVFGYDQTFSLSLQFFTTEEKRFLPATLNGRRILSRILVKCRLTDDGDLELW